MKRLCSYLRKDEQWHKSPSSFQERRYFIYDEETRTKLEIDTGIHPDGDLKYDSFFKQGYVLFYLDHFHWGAIDDTGAIIIKPIYYNEFDFVDGKAIVIREGHYTGVINSLGEVIIPLVYQSIRRINGCFEAESDKESVVFDSEGTVIERRFKATVRDVNTTFDLVQINSGEYLHRPEYQSINRVNIRTRLYPYEITIAFIVCKDDKYGLIDSYGNLLYDCCLNCLIQREEKHSNDELLFFREGDRSGYFDYSLKQHYFYRFGEYEIFYNPGPGIRLFKNKEILVPPIPGKSLSYLGDNLFLVDKGFKNNRDYICGVIDEHGNEITPFEGKRVVYLGNGLIIYYPRTKDGWEDKPFLYNRVGEILVHSKYQGIGNQYAHIKPEILYGKYILVYNYTDYHYHWGLIDTNGKELIEPKYEISLFKRINGFIFNNRIIVDNELNSLCILPQGSSSLFHHDFDKTDKAVITIYEKGHNSYGLFSLPGSFYMLPNATYQYIEYANENRIIIYDVKLGYGYTDESGNLIIPLRYDEAHSFIDAKAKVRLDTDYGYINREGELLLDETTILPKEYDWGWQFDDIVIAKKNGTFGCLKKDLSVVIPFEFSSKEEVQERVSLFKTIGPKNKTAKPFIDQSTGLFGILSENNDILVPAIFEEILGVPQNNRYHDLMNPIDKEFKSELIPVKFGPSWGYIDTDGRIAIPFVYRKVSNFSEGLAIATYIDRDVEQGFINQKGEMVIPIQKSYRIISGFSGGTATIEIDPCIPGKDNYEVYVNKRGEFLD